MHEIPIGNIIFFWILAALFVICVLGVTSIITASKKVDQLIDEEVIRRAKQSYDEMNVGLDILQNAEEARDDFPNNS